MENLGFLTKLSGTYLTPGQDATFTISVFSPQMPPHEPVQFEITIDNPKVLFLESMWELFKEILLHPVCPKGYETWAIKIDDDFKYHARATPSYRIIGQIKVKSYPGLEAFSVRDGSRYIDYLYQTILNGLAASITKTKS